MEVVHQAGDSKSPPEKKKRNVSHNARENTDNNDDFKTNNKDKTSGAEQCQAQKSSVRRAYKLGVAQFGCNSRNIN